MTKDEWGALIGLLIQVGKQVKLRLQLQPGGGQAGSDFRQDLGCESVLRAIRLQFPKEFLD